MHERITLISHFDKDSTTKIIERINKLGKNKKICKVPFGKNVDNREKAALYLIRIKLNLQYLHILLIFYLDF